MVKPPVKPPKKKAEAKAKLTDKERHVRFVDVARTVDADETPEAFDKAFDKVLMPKQKR